MAVNPVWTTAVSAKLTMAIVSSGRFWSMKLLAADLAASIGAPCIEPEVSMTSTTPTGTLVSPSGATSTAETGLPSTVIDS